MPDDPNAALISKMIAANYGGTMEDAMRGIGSENMEAEAAAMSRVLAVVREHEGQALDEALNQLDSERHSVSVLEKRVAGLMSERDEALRRRDAWRAKAWGYDEMAAAVRAKIREAGPSAGRALLHGALVEAERRIADLAATPDLRAAAILFRCPEGFEAMAAALGIADDTEARGKLDAAFKTVARNAKEKPDDNA